MRTTEECPIRARRPTTAAGIALCITLLFISLLAGCTSPLAQNSGLSQQSAYPTPTPFPTVTPGPVPGTALPSLEGEELSLEAWRGKGVILNFWATWCYPCRLEMPHLAVAHGASEDVVVIGVNFEEAEAEARAFVEEFAIPFPVLLDEEGRLGRALSVRGLPTTFFIDAEGRVVGSHIGPLTPEMLEEIVEQLKPS